MDANKKRAMRNRRFLLTAIEALALAVLILAGLPQMDTTTSVTASRTTTHERIAS